MCDKTKTECCEDYEDCPLCLGYEQRDDGDLCPMCTGTGSVKKQQEMSQLNESRRSFAKRVLAATGMVLEDIPWGVRDNACRYVFAKRGDLLVVGYYDYPGMSYAGAESFWRVDMSEPDMGPCGYCGAAKDEECDCNGFGGPKGLSREEHERQCGYCRGGLVFPVPDPFRKNHYVGSSQTCGCDGWGALEPDRTRPGRCPVCGCCCTLGPRGDKECPACEEPLD